ncbi:MAG: histidinol-phosphate transaminase [Candidatus Micrarchaeota archaeon]
MRKALDLIRKEVRELEPYSADRYVYPSVETFLDFNENAFGSPVEFEGQPVNRYPIQQVSDLKSALAKYVGKGIKPENMLLGNGSDEIIDVTVRAVAGTGDNVVIVEPGYSLFEVCVRGAGAEVRAAVSDEQFQPDVEKILGLVDGNTKMIVVVSPSSGSGMPINVGRIRELVERSGCLVFVDEAYVEFGGETVAPLVLEYENLVVSRTLSKAWGLAGLRIGYLVASQEIAAAIDKIRMPENMNSVSTLLALKALENMEKMLEMMEQMRCERLFLKKGLESKGLAVFDSVANFLVFRLPPGLNASSAQKKILASGVLVRNRSSLPLLKNCLRATVGTREENERFLDALDEVLGV